MQRCCCVDFSGLGLELFDSGPSEVMESDLPDEQKREALKRPPCLFPQTPMKTVQGSWVPVISEQPQEDVRILLQPCTSADRHRTP